MNRKIVIILIVCGFFLGVSGTYIVLTWQKEAPQSKQEEVKEKKAKEKTAQRDFTKVKQAYELITTSYVEKVDGDKLLEGAVQGMLGTLGDPYSVYMDAKTAAQFNESLDAAFYGIGAEIAVRDGKLLIIAPFKNSPAENAGIKPQDKIIKIDGENVIGLDVHEATLKIRGEKGTIVELEIERNGMANSLKIKVERDEIPIETVHGQIKEVGKKQIGYLEITSFSEKTALDFDEQLRSMEDGKLAGLIIDVRGNPGGLLVSVQDILNMIVTDRKPYVQIEQRNGERLPYTSTLKEKKPYPIVLLINGGSASASEILAGALKEVEGYALVGENTFGKGTVQQAVPMDDGSNIKLTMFKWLTPEGNWIHQDGIAPTVEVLQPAFFNINELNVEKPLVYDMNNPQVKIAQEMLQGIGFSPGRVDGYFSEETEKAVKAFQFHMKIPQNGKMDQKTAEALTFSIEEAIGEEENDLQLQTAIRLISKDK